MRYIDISDHFPILRSLRLDYHSILAFFLTFSLVKTKSLKFILFDPVRTRQDLLPLTYTRPIADCRLGIMTIREKWEHFLSERTLSLTEPYLEVKFPFCKEPGAHIYINASVIPDASLVAQIRSLQEEQALTDGTHVIAYHSAKPQLNHENIEAIAASADKVNAGPYNKISFPYDIFKMNGAEIVKDFELLTKGRVSQPLSKTNTLLGDEMHIFIEEGASVECSTFNVKGGPVYIGRDAEIMEGCLVRGPFALGDHAGLKMAAKIYGATTVGPHCRVGGEVSNGVFFGYSNKGHDGFVGNSVIGEWCNLGADTNTSNLKNNYGNVDVWNYREGKYISTGMQFHGLVMADHSKSSINTMFNTGTVVGVAANVFDSGFPDKFIPSFTWGGAEGLETFRFDKALEVAVRMMERRHVELTQADIDILKVVFEKEEIHKRRIADDGRQ
jgi:UDP-N-acetylglucosamine diphosphorylase/glucosamine-1-phosphate N-acetyltransferase